MLFRWLSLEGERFCTEVCREAQARTSSIYHVVQIMRDEAIIKCKHFDK